MFFHFGSETIVTETRKFVVIEFEDGSTTQYDIAWTRHIADYVEIAKDSLFERLRKDGRDGGYPLNDKRMFNGNHVTGKGRRGGPKAVRIVKEWIA
jgi:hypothetical protein